MGSRRRLAFLRSQELGLLCGLAVVILLALGSFVVAATRDGASAGLQTDELLPFFENPSPWHFWLYLLLPVFGLYAVNTTLCTWDTTLDRWRKGQRSPWQHGPAVLHVAFLFALFAHLVGGLGSRLDQPLAVGTEWTPLGDGRVARLGDVRPEFHPNGQLKQLTVTLDLAPEGQDVPAATVPIAFNRPLSSGWGSNMWFLAGVDEGPVVYLQPRHAPGVPWALVSALLLVTGTVLMGRRWL